MIPSFYPTDPQTQTTITMLVESIDVEDVASLSTNVSGSPCATDLQCYKLRSLECFDLELLLHDHNSEPPDAGPTLTPLPTHEPTAPSIQLDSCPGYHPLLLQILTLSRITSPHAAPAAVLLTGCSGVGKTFLLERLIGSMTLASTHPTNVAVPPNYIHRVSCQQLLLAAANGCGREVLLSIFAPFLQTPDLEATGVQRFLLIDDLHVLLPSEGDTGDGTTVTASTNGEAAAVLDAIRQTLDLLNDRHDNDTNPPSVTGCFVVGVCTTSHTTTIPHHLLEMPTPTNSNVSTTAPSATVLSLSAPHRLLTTPTSKSNPSMSRKMQVATLLIMFLHT